ncbi:galactoside alpha-(1,2)-fucosyltransferase 2-like [Tubulanus polymorphus]|uniref:galactoside alpha-(1,2)-fucosyltransferase 2-like n=1 Tax=Tubulanus polymorphus TaxID=672921 RepID=UPI003DA274DD
MLIKTKSTRRVNHRNAVEENRMSAKNKGKIVKSLARMKKSSITLQISRVPSTMVSTPIKMRLNSTETWRNSSETKIQFSKPLVYVTYMARLGNKLFEYALGFSATKRLNVTHVVGENDEILQLFQGTATALDNVWSYAKRWSPIWEKSYGKYDPDFWRKMNASLPRNITVIGYRQSWKYIWPYFDDLKKEFRLRSESEASARRFLTHAKIELNLLKNSADVTTTFVGVHVRVLDIKRSVHFQNYGYQYAPADYFLKAMRYFWNKYANCIFIVCSDSVRWVQENLIPSSALLPNSKSSGNNKTRSSKEDAEMISRVKISRNRSSHEDFSLLMSCNHSIMSVGTFGWWASFLAGGEVVYYRYPARPGSDFANDMNLSEFYPPKWKSMD